MPKHTLLIVCGILVVLLPYLGIPLAWKTVLGIGIGLAIIILALALRHGERTRNHARPETEPIDRPA